DDDQDAIAHRAITAQRFLSRLEYHSLRPQHREWLQRDSVKNLAKNLRGWTQTAVDYSRLLGQIERQESSAVDLAAIDIADAAQSLRFADQAAAQGVASAIDSHYRNANIRVALSDDFLERMLPATEPSRVPVTTQLLGSRVRGYSDVETRLAISLQPSTDRWSLHLRTVGHMQTRTVGTSSGVSIRTAGQSEFSSATPIVVTKSGVHVSGSSVRLNQSNRLRGISSGYDDWPLIGSLVRSIATDRYRRLKPLADRITSRQTEDQLARSVDDRVLETVNGATSQLTQTVLGPLGRLKLQPQVTDLQTTSERLIARYRLAGDWQLAAFTPRPRAPKESLMSLQVHQSAINNTVEQLLPRDHSKSVEDMLRDGLSMFGQSAVELPEDMPADVSVRFARTRPVTVEIDDGEVWLTLRVAKLSKGRGLDLRKFIVRANFLPSVDGLDAQLHRQGHLQVSGPGMRMGDRLRIRAIFNKLISPNRPLPLTLPQLREHPRVQDLAISQLELRDGWIGLAISKQYAPRIAMEKEFQRVSNHRVSNH
ncbi:MAG: hypothetical protein AAGA03_02940, partial [Planctomycetota bacterium]